jgi:hypothetical protein
MILTMQNKGCHAMKSPLRLLTLAFALCFLDSPPRTVQAADNPTVVRISSTLTRTSDTVGQLSVTADIASGFHIYAQSQPRPFRATTITVAESPVLRVTRTFTSSRPPKIIRHPTLRVELHEYEGQVTADKTEPAPEVDETLRRLGNKAASIPFYAIFPGGSSHAPILLDGLLTGPEPIVNALRRAGPSRPMLASKLKIAPASGNDAGGLQ